MSNAEIKNQFITDFRAFISTLQKSVTIPEDGQWTVKGFIDVFKNVYTISGDTKIVSKILEIHLFPTILKFADTIGYNIVLAECQNYYPDLTFVKKDDESVKFAVDLKTTFRRSNGKVSFTLGSHGSYFSDRNNSKNIQFPYNQYSGHFCLGIIYSRTDEDEEDSARDLIELETVRVADLGRSEQDHTDRNTSNARTLKDIPSVIKDFQFFFVEKWKIASDSQGSGNTANIGSISVVDDIINERGVFASLGEEYFDNYWLSYNNPYMHNGSQKKITSVYNFLEYLGELEAKRNLVGRGAKRYK